MRKTLPLIALVLFGCATLDDDRWRRINEDGVRLFAKGEYAQALDNFDYALTLRAQDPVLTYNVAQCYDRLGNARNAEQYYTACLQRDPNHADARLALVTLKYRAGKAAESNQMVQDWLKQSPDSADPYVADAWRLRQEKNLPLAQGRVLEALGKEPNNRRALTELAILDEMQNMPDRALVQYERILAREPNQIEIRERYELLKVKGVKRPLPSQ